MKNRRHNALRKAYEQLIENPYIDYENGKMLILSDSVTEKGEAKFYQTSTKECGLIDPGNLLCHAFWEGFPCWHTATLEIVEKISEDTAPQTTEIIAESVVEYDFRLNSENLIPFTIDPSTDDLDSIYVKAARILINHRLAENNNSIRQTAQSLGTAHSTICRLLAKFNAIGNVNQFPLAKAANEKFAIAA